MHCGGWRYLPRGWHDVVTGDCRAGTSPRGRHIVGIPTRTQRIPRIRCFCMRAGAPPAAPTDRTDRPRRQTATTVICACVREVRIRVPIITRRTPPPSHPPPNCATIEIISVSLLPKLEAIMLDNITTNDLFCEYYAQWITMYKEGAIRKVTMNKYILTQLWIKKLAPDLKICELSRITYQRLLNDYAELHERQTTMDFHHQLKGAILDAVDDGLIERDPTRKAIIKGKTPREKKIKYLNQFELHKLLSDLELGQELSWDWFILLVAKTGMRFSEALAITPNDFNFSKQSLSINKTWDYKGGYGFMPTKNQSSVRKIQIDWQLIVQFSTLVKNLPEDEPIFVSGNVYNSTVNGILSRHCKRAGIPVISIHGLRHTHASLLLFAGVSMASVARRLGHSSMTTTQKTYLHIIKELENKDVDLVMRSLSSLN